MLSAALAAATFAFASFAEGDAAGDARRSRRALYGFHAACAAAILLKGLVGVVLPGGAIVLWTLVTGRWRTLRRVFSPGPLLLFLALAVPWHVAMALRHPDFLQFYFVHEHFQRFATTEHRRTGPAAYFVPVLLAGFLPWTAFFGRFPRVLAGLHARRVAGPVRRGLPVDLGRPRLRVLLGVEVEADPVRPSDLAGALRASRARHRARPRARRRVPGRSAPHGRLLRAASRGGGGVRLGSGNPRALRKRPRRRPRARRAPRGFPRQRLAAGLRFAAPGRPRSLGGRPLAASSWPASSPCFPAPPARSLRGRSRRARSRS